MGTTYLGNSISLQMLGEDTCIQKSFRVSVDWVKDYLSTHDYVPIVGHEDTAKRFRELLSITTPLFNRIAATMQPGDLLVVGQLMKGRLAEGATTNVDTADFKWFAIKFGNEREE